jgi:hypothetical protein
LDKFNGRTLRLRGYHSYDGGWTVHGSGPVTVGVEMEVSAFSNGREEAIQAINKLGVREDYIFATTDGSLDSNGVEFVTHPMSLEYLAEKGFDNLQAIIESFKESGGKAEDARVSCGCHHNYQAPLSGEEWNPALSAVFRYFDPVFQKFNGTIRTDHYARIPPQADLYEYCKANGKYSFFNFRSNGIVEMRFPAMTLDFNKFKTQTTLCNNAVLFAVENKGRDIDVSEETFHTIFKPTSDELEVLSRMGVDSRILSGKI